MKIYVLMLLLATIATFAHLAAVPGGRAQDGRIRPR